MDDTTFAVTPEYQQKVLSVMLHNGQFCDVVGYHIKPEHFSNKVLQWFFNTLTHVDNGPHYSPVTLKERLIQAVKAKEIKEGEIKSFVTTYEQIAQQPLPNEETHIRQSFGTFVRTQNVKRAVLDSMPLIKAGKWDEIERAVVQAVQSGVDLSSLGHDYFGEFKDRLAARMNEEEDEKLPVGVPELDQKYLGGGLGRQQLGLIVGATGRGKSLFLQHISKHNVLLGRTVVYYTLELAENIIGMRLDAAICGIRAHDLKDEFEKSYNILAEMQGQYAKKLWLKQYPAQQASVATLKAHHRLLLEHGIVPDLICVDYLDLLKSEKNYSDPRFELDYITQCLRGWATEYNTRIWTATQMNRAGYNAENPDASNISEAFAKLFTVDVALFLAQTRAEQEDEFLRLLVEKNRNGPAGRTVKVDTDFSYMSFVRKIVVQSQEKYTSEEDT